MSQEELVARAILIRSLQGAGAITVPKLPDALGYDRDASDDPYAFYADPLLLIIGGDGSRSRVPVTAYTLWRARHRGARG